MANVQETAIDAVSGDSKSASKDDSSHLKTEAVEPAALESQNVASEDDLELIKMGKKPGMKRVYNFWTRKISKPFGHLCKKAAATDHESPLSMCIPGDDVRHLGLRRRPVRNNLRYRRSSRALVRLVSHAPSSPAGNERRELDLTMHTSGLPLQSARRSSWPRWQSTAAYGPRPGASSTTSKSSRVPNGGLYFRISWDGHS